VVYEAGYSRDYFAIYPSTIVSSEAAAASYGQDADHPLVVTLPSSYTLAQVSGTTSPCPMISTNEATSTGWDFYQLCSLLRLTVNDIPASVMRLEIDFGEKNVSGNFSIPRPGGEESYQIALDNACGSNSTIITIKEGTGEALGEGNLVLNIPLPTGNYAGITVRAYNDLSEGNLVKIGTVSFAYLATNTTGVKTAASLSPQIFFNFTFKNNDTELTNLRFVRIFSSKNKLYNSPSTKGPFTTARTNDETDPLSSPVQTALCFDSNPGDKLVFQVFDAEGKVYSGSIDVEPSTGYVVGQTYDIPVDVNLYTFTVAAEKKVCFSPGDLGVDDGVYSFTEPFTTWGHGSSDLNLTKRVWFNHPEVNHTDIEDNGHVIYGVKWRIQKSLSTTTTPHEWENIISRQMKSGVNPYYRVAISGHQYCLLLPPNETRADDIEDDLTSGTVNDYLKYIAKGFVLLMNTGKGVWAHDFSWGDNEEGWYWALWKDMNTNRLRFSWTGSGVPIVYISSQQLRLHARYMHDVDVEPESGGASGGAYNGFNHSNGNEEKTW
jgi:hypothetical protein